MNRAPTLSEQLDDVHGMLKSGFGWLTTSCFWLLTIRDGREERAREWLSILAKSDLVVSTRRVLQGSKRRIDQGRKKRVDEAVAIAFSFAGLERLGCKETSTHPFPTPFRSGMGSTVREDLLKDKPRQWRWSDVEGCRGRQTVHVVVAHWQSPGRVSRMTQPDPTQPDPEAFHIVKVENRPGSFRGDGNLYEPFGFRDGIAQPEIPDLREDGDDLKRAADHLQEDRLIAPGEFILGYRNEYDELTYCPDVQQWKESGRATHPGGRFTLNGSYLAVRQIEQDVKAFEEFETRSARLGVKRASEKLMGRCKDGMPLSHRGKPKHAVSDDDAFRYRVEDSDGFVCPKGAHIRRVHPRDSLGFDVQSGIKASKLHRLLRRGRPYLEETEKEKRVGLLFIACNADLERQFEFIQQRWLRNFSFGNLHHEEDPIVGSPALPKTFTVPGLPTGDKVSLAAFTRTIGGGYFFLPGMRALEFMVSRPPERSFPS